MPLNIVYHENFLNSGYANDPAAAEGRLDEIMRLVRKNPRLYRIIEPEPASEADILRSHTKRHFDSICLDPLLYELSALAAGGSILAAEEAFESRPSFAVIRPPGHHASADSCWGFCYFNNMSISLLKLFYEKKIKSAFVLDFDLHTGDGNINILERRSDGFIVRILNPMAGERSEYLLEVKRCMRDLENVDIFAASAGFDQGVDDWGGLLYPEDYAELGRLMKEYSEKLCNGRRYAILEGGYNHEALGINTEMFCGGFM